VPWLHKWGKPFAPITLKAHIIHFFPTNKISSNLLLRKQKLVEHKRESNEEALHQEVKLSDSTSI